MIKITPADIIQQQFRVVFRGFDMSEVDSFLSQVADELEELLSENASLKNELKKKEQQLTAYIAREEKLQDAIASIKKVTEEIKENAEKEAELIIKEARARAERILQESENELAEVNRKIAELKQHKIKLEETLKSILRAHLDFIEKIGLEFDKMATEERTNTGDIERVTDEKMGADSEPPSHKTKT